MTPNAKDTPLTDAAAQLRLGIVRTARRLRQEAAAEATGLTPTSTSALATIERHGPLTPSELAELERVRRPTITRTLGCLDCEGVIERTPDPSDGRSSLVSVNAAGRERLWQAVNVLGKVKDHLTRVVADGRLAQRQLSDLVHRPQ